MREAQHRRQNSVQTGFLSDRWGEEAIDSDRAMAVRSRTRCLSIRRPPRSSSRRPSERKISRTCRSAFRRSAHAASISSTSRTSRITPSSCRRSASTPRSQGQRLSTCAAWPPAATATIPAPCRRSASTLTNSLSRRSAERSTSTFTISPASRASRVLRARFTAPRAKPARSASSPTSRSSESRLGEWTPNSTRLTMAE